MADTGRERDERAPRDPERNANDESERKYDLYGERFKADPFPTFAAMREQDPVLNQLGLDGSARGWFLSRYEDVEAALRDDRRFVRDPALAGHEPPRSGLDALLNDHMLSRDGGDHRRLRALVQQAFTPRRVAALRPRVQALADALVDGVAGRGAMDLIAEFAFPLPTTVILEMLGVPQRDREHFRAWSNALIAPALDAASQAEAVSLLREFTDYLRSLFAERRAHPTDDLLTALLQAEEAGDRLTESELFSTMVLLIVAGHETTVNLLGNAVLALSRNEGARGALLQALHRGDADAVPRAVEEFLRYDGSVERAIIRWAAEDVELRGRRIRRGDPVILILSSANRDPRAFAAPDTLDLERAPNPHLGFGKGPHYCLGAPLARLEADVALSTLLGRLPGLRVAPGAELRYRPLPGFKALERLPVVWDLPAEG